MLIVHRCALCRHPDVWAKGTTIEPVTETQRRVLGAGRRTSCGERCHFTTNATGHRVISPCEWGEPEQAPEWDAVTHELVTTFRVPGTRIPGSVRTCDCPACRAFYREQTGV